MNGEIHQLKPDWNILWLRYVRMYFSPTVIQSKYAMVTSSEICRSPKQNSEFDKTEVWCQGLLYECSEIFVAYIL